MICNGTVTLDTDGSITIRCLSAFGAIQTTEAGSISTLVSRMPVKSRQDARQGLFRVQAIPRHLGRTERRGGACSELSEGSYKRTCNELASMPQMGCKSVSDE